MTYGKTQPCVFLCGESNFMGYTKRNNKTMMKKPIKKYCRKLRKMVVFKPKISKHSSN